MAKPRIAAAARRFAVEFCVLHGESEIQNQEQDADDQQERREIGAGVKMQEAQRHAQLQRAVLPAIAQAAPSVSRSAAVGRVPGRFDLWWPREACDERGARGEHEQNADQAEDCAGKTAAAVAKSFVGGEIEIQRERVGRDVREISLAWPTVRIDVRRDDRKAGWCASSRELSAVRKGALLGEIVAGGARSRRRRQQDPARFASEGRRSALALKTSKFAGMRWGMVIGAGEMAMVAATGSRSAMRMAMAPPMEWPSNIVFLGSIVPLRMRDSTAAVAHCWARAKENASWLSPWPGRSRRVGAQAVAGEIFGEVQHQAAIRG